tara:strand:- start:1564 stop:1794 length:231 start_codon:yes stop_codon:yes gene_type:complete
MKYLIHRLQGDLNLQIEEFKTKEEVDKKRKYWHQQYHDVIILDENDINKLGDKVFRHKISNINRRNNRGDNPTWSL